MWSRRRRLWRYRLEGIPRVSLLGSLYGIEGDASLARRRPPLSLAAANVKRVPPIRNGSGSLVARAERLDGEPATTSPAVALWRIVGSLTPEQARRLAREIKLVAAVAMTEPRRLGSASRVPEGVRARHSQPCGSRSGRVCDCAPRWEAFVYSKVDRAKIRKVFPERWEAKAWRHEKLELAALGRLTTSCGKSRVLGGLFRPV